MGTLDFKEPGATLKVVMNRMGIRIYGADQVMEEVRWIAKGAWDEEDVYRIFSVDEDCHFSMKDFKIQAVERIELIL